MPKGSVWIVDATWFGDAGSNVVAAESLAAGSKSLPIVGIDSSGNFRIDGLLPREYSLCAVDGRTLRAATLEGVRAGTLDVRIAIPDGGLYERVAGRVVNRAGEPVPGLFVSAERDGFLIRSPDGSHAYGTGVPLKAEETDADGRFDLGRVAKEEVSLVVRGDAIVHLDVPPPLGDRPDDLRLVVAMRCHLKVEMQRPSEGATGFRVLDADGRALDITIYSGRNVRGSPQGTLTDGVSEVVTVEDSARTLVVLQGSKELRRIPLSLKPGPPTIVRP